MVRFWELMSPRVLRRGRLVRPWVLLWVWACGLLIWVRCLRRVLLMVLRVLLVGLVIRLVGYL